MTATISTAATDPLCRCLGSFHCRRCLGRRRRATSASCFNIRSFRRSRSPGKSRPCCRSSTSTSAAKNCRSTTRRCRPSIRSADCGSTNTTDLHLMQGPITVFDGGIYAGDARIEDIAPGGERLLTYALDLDVECTSEMTAAPEEIDQHSAAKGVLHAERKQVRTRQVQNQKLGSKGQNRPRRAAARNRLETWSRPKSRPKKPAPSIALPSRPSRAKRPRWKWSKSIWSSQQIEIANIDDATIRFFQSQRAISPEAKAALEKIDRHENGSWPVSSTSGSSSSSSSKPSTKNSSASGKTCSSSTATAIFTSAMSKSSATRKTRSKSSASKIKSLTQDEAKRRQRPRRLSALARLEMTRPGPCRAAWPALPSHAPRATKLASVLRCKFVR